MKLPAPIRSLLLGLAAVAGLAFAGLALTGNLAHGGIPLILGFVCLSVACSGHEKFGGLSYTMLILALISAALYFPAPLQRYGSFEFKVLIVPLLQIIMFSVGSQMSLRDFESIVRTPKAVFVGLAATWGIMPIIGVTLANTIPLPTEIAAGVILMGCVPAGLASNVMCFIARANLALSVTLTACSTLLAPLLTPMLMKVLAGQFVEISFWKMMADIIQIVIYPIMAGLMFNAAAYRADGRLRMLLRQGAVFAVLIVAIQSLLDYFIKGAIEPRIILRNAAVVLLLAPAVGAIVRLALGSNKALLDRIMGFCAMAGLCVILTVITAAGRDSLLTIGLWLLLACLIHNVGGYIAGYGFARLVGLDEQSCRTVALEVGQQNGGLASGLALGMGKVATLGLAATLFGALQNITGSAIATWWRYQPVKSRKS